MRLLISVMSSLDPVHIQDEEDKMPGWLASIYRKILNSCNSKIAPYLLSILSFTESCVFIIPPEVLMLPMCYANRKKSFYWAFLTTITSVLGAIAGYYLGAHLWESFFREFAFTYIPGFEKHFETVGALYQENAISALFIAAFTPIPFKVFTVVAGVYSAKISLLVLIGTSFVGRGARYTILCALVYFFGARAQEMIEKHFKTFTIVVGILAVIAAVLFKMLK